MRSLRKLPLYNLSHFNPEFPSSDNLFQQSLQPYARNVRIYKRSIVSSLFSTNPDLTFPDFFDNVVSSASSILPALCVSPAFISTKIQRASSAHPFTSNYIPPSLDPSFFTKFGSFNPYHLDDLQQYKSHLPATLNATNCKRVYRLFTSEKYGCTTAHLDPFSFDQMQYNLKGHKLWIVVPPSPSGTSWLQNSVLPVDKPYTCAYRTHVKLFPDIKAYDNRTVYAGITGPNDILLLRANSLHSVLNITSSVAVC